MRRVSISLAILLALGAHVALFRTSDAGTNLFTVYGFALLADHSTPAPAGAYVTVSIRHLGTATTDTLSYVFTGDPQEGGRFSDLREWNWRRIGRGERGLFEPVSEVCRRRSDRQPVAVSRHAVANRRTACPRRRQRAQSGSAHNLGTPQAALEVELACWQWSCSMGPALPMIVSAIARF